MTSAIDTMAVADFAVKLTSLERSGILIARGALNEDPHLASPLQGEEKDLQGEGKAGRGTIAEGNSHLSLANSQSRSVRNILRLEIREGS